MDDLRDLISGGAIGHYRLTDCTEIVFELIHNVFGWRNEKNVGIAKGQFTGEYGGDIYASAAASHMYSELCCSQLAVAAICPLFETLFYRAFAKIGEKFDINRTTQTHPRITSKTIKDDDRWNPGKVLFLSNGKFGEDIRKGTIQLLDALGYPGSLRADFAIIDPLFWYRNRILHEGYEWKAHTATNATDMIEKEKWEIWFSPILSDNKVVGYTLNDNLVDAALKCLETVASKLRQIEYDLKPSPK